jgi:uncharacterized membrane protein YfcA
MCVHKSVFPPRPPEIIGVILLPLLLGFANNGGIGGGGLIIPASIALFGFNTIQAIAISNAIICVGAVVRYFGFSIFQKHPEKDATIVNYNLVAIMMPMVLIGSFVGVMISNLLPEAVLTIILVLLLFYLTYDSFSKAFELWGKETIAIQREGHKPLPGSAAEMAVLNGGGSGNGGNSSG